MNQLLPLKEPSNSLEKIPEIASPVLGRVLFCKPTAASSSPHVTKVLDAVEAAMIPNIMAPNMAV